MIHLFEILREQKERAYFALGNHLSSQWITQMKYVFAFCIRKAICSAELSLEMIELIIKLIVDYNKNILLPL